MLDDIFFIGTGLSALNFFIGQKRDNKPKLITNCNLLKQRNGIVISHFVMHQCMYLS